MLVNLISREKKSESRQFFITVELSSFFSFSLFKAMPCLLHFLIVSMFVFNCFEALSFLYFSSIFSSSVSFSLIVFIRPLQKHLYISSVGRTQAVQHKTLKATKMSSWCAVNFLHLGIIAAGNCVSAHHRLNTCGLAVISCGESFIILSVWHDREAKNWTYRPLHVSVLNSLTSPPAAVPAPPWSEVVKQKCQG